MKDVSRESIAQHDDQSLLSDRAFNKHSIQDGKHVSPFNRNRLDIGLDRITVKLVQGIHEEDFKQVVGRGVMGTTGIDPDNLPADLPWEEMMKGGLQTALETQVVVFEVAGISRACTHQLVRTRRATFHQQSQRATFMGEDPDTRMPESVWRNEEAREIWIGAIEVAHAAYRIACEAGVSYQDARFILPEATETYIVCEYPLRTFIETYAYRGCSLFQWEHVHVMREMRRLLVKAHPFLDPYIKISCEKTSLDPALRKCTYQGWEAVDEQCDFPWAREDNRTYRPDSALRIGPKR